MKNKKVIILVLTIAAVTFALLMSPACAGGGGPVAVIEGTVTDAVTALPIEGATVDVGGFLTLTTNNLGIYKRALLEDITYSSIFTLKSVLNN